MVRNSGPTYFGPVRWSGFPDQLNFGPVRWSGIPDQLFLVRSGGPESRTGPCWSDKVVRVLVRNSGPDQFWSGLVRIFAEIFKMDKNEKKTNFQTFSFRIGRNGFCHRIHGSPWAEFLDRHFINRRLRSIHLNPRLNEQNKTESSWIFHRKSHVKSKVKMISCMWKWPRNSYVSIWDWLWGEISSNRWWSLFLRKYK